MTNDKKIYTSFHEIPPREYMYFPKGTIDIGKPGEFSKIEMQHIILSVCVLTLAFSFALTGNNVLSGFYNLSSFFSGLLMSFLGIITAFFFHELSHKFIAQKYGLWAEYRMYPYGLLLALSISIIIGFVFAAPGAVMFRGNARIFETGKIAAVGPLANIVIAIIIFPFYIILFYETSLSHIFGFICLINSVLATFNLIPFGPLDGVKIIKWNATVWIILLIISITMMTTMFRFIPTLSY
jgi:Zn-dependent protease